MLSPDPVAAQSGGLPSFWELTVAGGPLMWPLGVCSIVALAYVVERAIRLRRQALGSERFERSLVEALAQGGVESAGRVCAGSSTPLARILRVALDSASDPGEVREKRVEDFAAVEVKRLGANLRPLMIVYVVAPLLGLLGTVWGLIIAFATIAMEQGLGRPELLAVGVYQALVTTAAGLGIAIPAVIAYYFFKGRIENFARRTEGLYVELERHLTREVARASA